MRDRVCLALLAVTCSARGGGPARAVLAAAPVVALLAVLAGCDALPGTPVDRGAPCPSLEQVCPNLSCVEPRRDDEGCPICECAVQACTAVGDCLDRGVDVVCDVSHRFCEPAPDCTDGDDETPCAAACYGRCIYAGERSRDDGYCARDDDCGDGETCRQTVCVDDPTTPTFFDCVGWCAGDCPPVETTAYDPFNGWCTTLPDGCIPPGWQTDVCG
jgi:hypothetical protein